MTGTKSRIAYKPLLAHNLEQLRRPIVNIAQCQMVVLCKRKYY
jgi:hypothetical protein